MQVVLLSDTGRWRVNLDTRLFAGAGMLAIVVAVAAFYAGHTAGLGQLPPVRSDARFERDMSLLIQQREINLALVELNSAVSALADHSVDLSGRMDALEASGRQLAKSAGMEMPSVSAREATQRGELIVDTAAREFADAFYTLAEVSGRIDALAPRMDALETALILGRVDTRTQPAGRPVQKGWISSPFGWRTDPLNSRRAFHDGIDVAGRYRSPVISVADGVVAEVSVRRGYGNIIEVRHRYGLSTRYAHNAKNLVAVGDRVARGDVIALMGSTGRSTGAHVHFEVIKDDQRVNPRPFTRSQ
jgi:murein DD-endopeptidase MepM/ murein hydrolase activator NlpD